MTAKNHFMLMLFFLWVFAACTSKPEVLFHEGRDIVGLATPIEVSGSKTLVNMQDYFVDAAISGIDSVSAPASLKANLSSDKKSLALTATSLRLPIISELKIWINGTPYSILLQRALREQHTFRFDPEGKRFRNVAIRGELSDWNPVPMKMVDGKWEVSMNLTPGRYQYLIVTDGRDILDPSNPVQVSNSQGGYNSLIEIGAIDRDVLPRIIPHTYTSKKHRIELQTHNDIDQVLVFWQNFRLPDPWISQEENVISLNIPGDAFAMRRSFLRVFTANESGLGNDLLIPLDYGEVVTDPDKLTREDREATIMYFLMVDRFHNGNPDNDDPVDDPEVADRVNFWGGDLNGVLEKIVDGYFTEIGVNAVWFSPIAQNPLEAYIEFPEPKRKFTGYHGYWPISLTQIDHRFGSEEVLETLVKEAHERDISVLLDFVSNHVHKNNPLIVENPHFATTFDLPDGRQNIRIWDEHRLTTWFDDFLPTLDFSQPEVIQTMVDTAFYWLDRYNLDGFRHDATKHVPIEFWRALSHKIREDKMIRDDFRIFQIGETFGSHELIGSYVGSGLLDGQFDFNLYWDVRSVFAVDEVPFERLDYSLHQSFSWYGYQNMMGNITGNHDMPRFISFAGGDLRFDENVVEAGWDRNVGVGDPVGYDKLSALNAFTLTIPGIPVIYYGDEIGLPGASDPDSRRPMIFDNLTENQQKVKDKVKKLTRIRSNNLAFIYGDFNTVKLSDDIYAYARSYFESQGIVVFNKSNQDKELVIDLPHHFQPEGFASHFGNAFTYEGSSVKVSVPAYGFEILTR